MLRLNVSIASDKLSRSSFIQIQPMLRLNWEGLNGRGDLLLIQIQPMLRLNSELPQSEHGICAIQIQPMLRLNDNGYTC